MSQLFTPKNAEQKIFHLAIFQDGIWDMQIGGTIVLFSSILSPADFWD